MVTLAQLKIYNSFCGDIDGYARSGSKKQRAILDDDQWMVIQRLIDGFSILNSGYSSDPYTASIQKLVSEHCDSDEVVAELKRLSRKRY